MLALGTLWLWRKTPHWSAVAGLGALVAVISTALHDLSALVTPTEFPLSALGGTPG